MIVNQRKTKKSVLNTHIQIRRRRSATKFHCRLQPSKSLQLVPTPRLITTTSSPWSRLGSNVSGNPRRSSQGACGSLEQCLLEEEYPVHTQVFDVVQPYRVVVGHATPDALSTASKKEIYTLRL